MKIQRNGKNDFNVRFQNPKGDEVLAMVTNPDGGSWQVAVMLRDEDGSFDRLVRSAEFNSLEDCLDDLFILERSRVFSWEHV